MDENGDSVSICFSKRASGKYKYNENIKLKNTQPRTRKHILVIGGGVAGLASAAELKRCGHDVTIYERHSSLGGMLNQGIPVFRLPRKIIEKEIKQITDLGIKVELDKNISSNRDIEKLSREFDAVVCAMGTLKPNYLINPLNKINM